jgi:hypothetical protein
MADADEKAKAEGKEVPVPLLDKSNAAVHIEDRAAVALKEDIIELLQRNSFHWQLDARLFASELSRLGGSKNTFTGLVHEPLAEIGLQLLIQKFHDFFLHGYQF